MPGIARWHRGAYNIHKLFTFLGIVPQSRTGHIDEERVDEGELLWPYMRIYHVSKAAQVFN